MKYNSLLRALLVSIVFMTIFLPHKSSAELGLFICGMGWIRLRLE